MGRPPRRTAPLLSSDQLEVEVGVPGRVGLLVFCGLAFMIFFPQNAQQDLLSGISSGRTRVAAPDANEHGPVDRGRDRITEGHREILRCRAVKVRSRVLIRLHSDRLRIGSARSANGRRHRN